MPSFLITVETIPLKKNVSDDDGQLFVVVKQFFNSENTNNIKEAHEDLLGLYLATGVLCVFPRLHHHLQLHYFITQLLRQLLCQYTRWTRGFHQHFACVGEATLEMSEKKRITLHCLQ